MSEFAHIIFELGGQNSDTNVLGGPSNVGQKKISAAQFLKYLIYPLDLLKPNTKN